MVGLRKATAGKWGYTKIATLLLNRGVGVNAGDKEGLTPLFEAATAGNTETMAFLRKHGGVQ